MAAKKTGKKMKTHVDRTTTPYTGVLQIDATSVASILVDLAPGGMQGLRRPGPGIGGVEAELAGAMPTKGAGAGISPDVYQAFVNTTNNLAQLKQVAQPLLKLAEVFTETIALLEDAREHQLSKMADAVRSTAKRDKNDGIKAPFQKTLAYKSAVAAKGAKTKAEKKAKASTSTSAPASPPAG